jgi:DNA-binding NtrC family response regulator
MEMQALRGPGASPTAPRTLGRGLNTPLIPTDFEAIQALLDASGEADEPLDLRLWLEQAEAWYIARTLRALKGNRSAAARALGIGRRTLYAKMQKLGIEASWSPPGRR